MATLGGSCTDVGIDISSGLTLIYDIYPFPDDGNITSFCVWTRLSGSIKLKIFRSDGLYWRFIGESALESVSAGYNNFTCNINVLSGDFVCLYSSGSYPQKGTAGSNKEWQKSGDISADTLKSEFIFYNGNISALSLVVTYTVIPRTKVQINIGDTWKNVPTMKINIGDSWKDVVSVKQNIGDTWKTVF